MKRLIKNHIINENFVGAVLNFDRCDRYGSECFRFNGIFKVDYIIVSDILDVSTSENTRICSP
jgi:hypothetical protein